MSTGKPRCGGVPIAVPPIKSRAVPVLQAALSRGTGVTERASGRLSATEGLLLKSQSTKLAAHVQFTSQLPQRSKEDQKSMPLKKAHI